MNFEVTSEEGNELLLHKYTKEWKLNNVSATSGKTFKTPAFCPIYNVDLKFCFESSYDKEVSFPGTYDVYSLFKLTLIKLVGANIPPNMQLEINVKVYYSNGSLYKEYKSDSIVDLEKMNSIVCMNERNIVKDRSQNYAHWKNMKSDCLILKCELLFSGHLSKTLDTWNDLCYLNNLKDFMSNFKSMEETTALSDVMIHIENETLPAHKFVLATHSPVFKKMITSDFVESKANSITVMDCDIDTFKHFLNYLYSGEVAGDSSWLALNKLYVLADKYDVASLKRALCDKMESCISLDNIYDILKFSYAYNDKNMQYTAKLFAGAHFQSLKCKKEWEELVQEFPIIGYEILANLCPIPIDS